MSEPVNMEQLIVQYDLEDTGMSDAIRQLVKERDEAVKVKVFALDEMRKSWQSTAVKLVKANKRAEKAESELADIDRAWAEKEIKEATDGE